MRDLISYEFKSTRRELDLRVEIAHLFPVVHVLEDFLHQVVRHDDDLDVVMVDIFAGFEILFEVLRFGDQFHESGPPSAVFAIIVAYSAGLRVPGRTAVFHPSPRPGTPHHIRPA